MIYETKHPKIQPENFQTKLGRKLAKERFEFLKKYIGQFLDEWNGEK